MLKNLLNRFSGKKTDTPPPDEPTANELITVYDAYGRELKITRAEWLDKVLLPSIKTAWDNSDELYGRIVGALNDGFVSQVADASARLVSIDPIVERSHVIRAIVLMKTGDLDQAESLLRKAIDKVGETGTLLTNLAKIYTERKDIARSDEVLWRAIQLDPNQDNGLGWWTVIQREREGETGYVSALEKAAAIEGSWRPQLWLARHHLEKGNAAAAKALYQDVLTKGLFQDDALMTISGDLGNHRQIEWIPELIAPVFDPNRHDPRAGLNLLQAYLELGRRTEGEALLNKLYALNAPPFKQHFDHYAAEFQKLENKDYAPQPIESPQELQIENVLLDRPIWMHGLSDPTWLFSQKTEQSKKVTFLSFAKIQAKEKNAEMQREDEIGRMTRAIPLYLSESVHFWTDFKGLTLIPTVKGGGPVVFGGETDGTELCDQFKEQSDYLVTGAIAEAGGKWRISIYLYNCANKACLVNESIESTQEELGADVLRIEQILLDRLGQKRTSPVDDYYAHPTKDVMGPYLIGIGQHFMLTLLANDAASKDGLWGERNMLEWPLNMALTWSKADVPKIMFLSGLAKASKYQSAIINEFKDRTLALIKDAKNSGSATARLEPLAWKLFGMEKQLSAYMHSTDTDKVTDYGKWINRLRTQT